MESSPLLSLLSLTSFASLASLASPVSSFSISWSSNSGTSSIFSPSSPSSPCSVTSLIGLGFLKSWIVPYLISVNAAVVLKVFNANDPYFWLVSIGVEKIYFSLLRIAIFRLSKSIFSLIVVQTSFLSLHLSIEITVLDGEPFLNYLILQYVAPISKFQKFLLS